MHQIVVVFDFSFTGPENVPQRTDRTPEDWLSSTAAWAGPYPRMPSSLLRAQLKDRKELRDISGLWMGSLHVRKQKQPERYPTRDGSWQARPGRSLQDQDKREVPHYKRNLKVGWPMDTRRQQGAHPTFLG